MTISGKYFGDKDFVIVGYLINTLERLALISFEDNESRYNFVMQLHINWRKLERH